MAMRRAVIFRSSKNGLSVDEVSAYLPSNYNVIDQSARTITVEGQDVAGWTLDGYVIPRLASALIFAEEVYRTKTGRFLTDVDIQAFAGEDEREEDPS